MMHLRAPVFTPHLKSQVGTSLGLRGARSGGWGYALASGVPPSYPPFFGVIARPRSVASLRKNHRAFPALCPGQIHDAEGGASRSR